MWSKMAFFFPTRIFLKLNRILRLPELYCLKTDEQGLKPEDVLALRPQMKPYPGPHQYCSAIINKVRDDQPVKGWLPWPLPVLSLYCSQMYPVSAYCL